jgi:spermidine synthase
MATQTGFAYFPLFLAPQAKEVLVIGFGSGTTVGSALLFPQVQVTCCEIEPAVYEGARIFKEYNHDPHAKAEAEAPQARRLRMVFDDGRSHLQGTDKRYDVILSEPSNPWLAGISNLFTREFYQAVKPKLAPGGVLAQWIQSYSFTSRDYAMVVRTLLEVFPECALIRITSGDTMLVAGSQPFFPSAATLDLGQAIIDTQPALKDDLLKYYGITDLRSFLLVHWILDRDGLVRLANSIQPPTINTDRNMKLEFDAPLRLFDETDSRVEVMKPILAAADLKWFEKAAAAWGSSPVQAAAIKRLLEVFDRKAHADLFRGLVAIGLRLDPEHLDLLADKLSLSGEIGEAELQAAIEKALATSAKDANRLGVLLFKGGQHERALAVFSRMLASHPYSVNTLQNMAVAYDAWGKTDDAAATFEKALELDPMNETTRKSYANFAEKLRRQAAKNAAGDGPAGPLPEGSAPPEAKAAAEHEGGKEP